MDHALDYQSRVARLIPRTSGFFMRLNRLSVSVWPSVGGTFNPNSLIYLEMAGPCLRNLCKSLARIQLFKSFLDSSPQLRSAVHSKFKDRHWWGIATFKFHIEFHPQNQKGKKHTHKLITLRETQTGRTALCQTGDHSAILIENSSNIYSYLIFFLKLQN